MWDLFKAELLRFRGWAIAYAVLHLLVLAFLTRVLDLAQQALLVYRAFAGVYALTGLLLGLYQMGGYRRPNIWLNLLHRPLPTWQVAIALVGAGAVTLMLAIAVPALMIAGGQEAFTARVVDLRHWLLPLAVLLIALCTYLAGAYSMLGGKRHAVLVMVLPLLIWSSPASGLGALMVLVVLVAWLGVLVAFAFKHDLSAPPRSPLAVVLTALPVQMGACAVLMVVGFAFEFVWIALGTHPRNSTPPPGGYVEASRSEGAALFQAGLRGRDDAQTQLLREQVGISEVVPLRGRYDQLPLRNELTNQAPMEFEDVTRRVRWIFSHDTMRFQGVRLADGRAYGQLGAGADGAPFPAPALPLGDNLFATARVVYRYDSNSQRAWPRLAVPAPESIARAETTPIGGHVTLLSDRALYFFNANELAEDDRLLQPRLRVPLPAPIGDLDRIDLIELLDGYLLSFTYGGRLDKVGADAFQQIVQVDASGKSQTVAHRALRADSWALWRYQDWWPSPLLYAAFRGAERLSAAPAPLQAKAPTPWPRSMLWTAAGSMLLSLLLAAWRLRRLPLTGAARRAWLLACGAIGLPALVSLWLLYPEREPLDDMPMAQPATG